MPQIHEPSTPPRPESGTPLSLPLDVIDDNPWQPRITYDAEKLEELCRSIRTDGLLQPVVVRRGPAGRYQLIAGHRRLRAFRALRDRSDAHEERRFASIPALLKADATDDEMARLSLNENLQRDELLPTEAAAALAAYRDMTGVKTSKQLAQAMGLNENRVKRLLRLHDAPPFIKAAITEGLLVELPTPAGTPSKRVRRRLDMMGSLELGRLHKELFARDSKRAEAKVRAIIERALREDWPFRRIQKFVETELANDGRALSGGVEAEPTTAESPAARPVFTRRGELLTVDLSRTDELSVDERHELRLLLQPILPAAMR